MCHYRWPQQNTGVAGDRNHGNGVFIVPRDSGVPIPLLPDDSWQSD
jgi:hypothetical protein